MQPFWAYFNTAEKLEKYLNYVGCLLVVFSIVKCGIAVATTLFLKSNSYGLWWVAIPTFIVGLFSFKSSNKGLHRIGFFFSSIIWILTFAVILIDGFQASLIENLEGCYDPHSGASWGEQSGIIRAMNCTMSSEAQFTYADGAGSQCVCVSKEGHCYGYDLANGSNCGTIFTVYFDELAASCAFSTVLCFMVSVYIVLAGKKVRLRENEALNSVPIPTIELRDAHMAGLEAATPYMVVEAAAPDDIELQQTNSEGEYDPSGHILARTGIQVQARPLE